MIKACIFDLDGTLLETIHTITYYVNFALEKNKIPKITEDECKYFVGKGAKILIRRALNSKGIVDEQVYDKVYFDYNEAYDSEPLYLTAAFDGIYELLSKIKERGIRLAVLSNKPDFPVQRVISKFFPNTFDIVMGSREGVPLKPFPDSSFEILDGLSVSPAETAFIGDTENDIETGKNLGVALNIAVSWGFRTGSELKESEPDIIIDTPMDIIREIIKIK